MFDAVTVFQMVKDDYEDDAHIFRKAANDITSQLEINFGNLPRPGRGARGGPRGGRGRIRRAENYVPRAEVVVSVCILNPERFSEGCERVSWAYSLILEGHQVLSWILPLPSVGLMLRYLER